MLIFVLVDVPTDCGAVVAGNFFAAAATGAAGFGVALGAGSGVALGPALAAALAAALGVALGVALAAALGVALAAALGVALATAFGVALATALGVALAAALGVALATAFGVALATALGVVFGAPFGLGVALGPGLDGAVAFIAFTGFWFAAGLTSLTSDCATRLMALAVLPVVAVFFAGAVLALAGRLATAVFAMTFGADVARLDTGLTGAFLATVLALTGLGGVFFTTALPGAVDFDFRAAGVALVANLRAALPWVRDLSEGFTLVATIRTLSSNALSKSSRVL